MSAGFAATGAPGLQGNNSADDDTGVVGSSTSGLGVYGNTISGVGTAGVTVGGGPGVLGFGGVERPFGEFPEILPFSANGNTIGVYGSVGPRSVGLPEKPSETGVSCGVWGDGYGNTGVLGSSNDSNGVQGQSASPANSGVWGSNTVGGTGVTGSSSGGNSQTGNGVSGQSTSSAASGVSGSNTGGGTGVAGSSTGPNSGNGVTGQSSSSAASGVWGTTMAAEQG